MLRLPATVQTLPVVCRDGKCYGRILIDCGGRQLRILAEGDQDLIEQVYSQARLPAPEPSCPSPLPACEVSGQVDPELAGAVRILVIKVRRGDTWAVERMRSILRAAQMGDSDSVAIYDAICFVLRSHPELGQ